MIRKIDLYIFKKFIGTFVFSIALIILIVIVFDLSERIEDFIRKDAPLHAIIFDYYLNFIPYFINLFSPLFTFIAVIYFTSKMAGRSEIVAILSSGVSFYRMLLPYLAGAMLIAGMSYYLNHYVIPKTNKKRVEFENKFVRSPFHNHDINIHRKLPNNRYIYFENFRNWEGTGYKFSLEVLKDQQLIYKLSSETIKWDSVRQHWILNNYMIRKMDGMQESLFRGQTLDTVLDIHPREFERKDHIIEAMDKNELNRFIDEERSKGAGNVELYEIEKYKRTAFPFATFILTLIGVAVASRKTRGGIGIHIGTGLFISFSFIMFMQVTTTFAASGLVNPSVAVWIPNFIFGILAIYLLKVAPK